MFSKANHIILSLLRSLTLLSVIGLSINSAQAQNSSFSFLETSYDFKLGAIVLEVKCNTNCSTLLDKSYFLKVSVPGTTVTTGSIGWFTNVNLSQNLELSSSIPREGIEEILSHYPGGIIPIQVTLNISKIPGAWSGYDWNNGLVPNYLAYSGSHSVKIWLDNHEFSIGVIQVVPPNFDLNQQQLCFWRDEKWGSPGWDPVGISTDCAKEWDWGSNEATITTQSYPLSPIIFSDKAYTTINNLNNARGKNVGSSNIYSFKSIIQYWKDLLAKHSISSEIETPLGKNPSFTLTFIPPVSKTYTITSNDHGEVKAFFRDVVRQANIDVSKYDFVVYMMYIPSPSTPGVFLRSFAAGNSTYAAIQLTGDYITSNRSYLTLVHELGHMLFGLRDLYEGFGVQYPKGVPNPSVVTQEKACIMAKGFAYELNSPSVASLYNTVEEQPSVPFVLNKPRYYTADPKNYILCADDLLVITKGRDNPNCSITDFYAGKCGVSCSSENYWTCRSSGVLPTATPTRTPTRTPTSTATPAYTATGVFTATRTVTPYPTPVKYPYQNPSNPLDVNNDSLITEADHKIIVDLLNAGRSGPLAPPPAGVIVNIFADTSGDNFLAANDLLLIVNYLAGRKPETLSPTPRVPAPPPIKAGTPSVKATAKPSAKIRTPEQRKKQRQRLAAKKKAEREKKRLLKIEV